MNDWDKIKVGDWVRVEYRYYQARLIAQGYVRDKTDNHIVVKHVDMKRNESIYVAQKDLIKLADHIAR